MSVDNKWTTYKLKVYQDRKGPQPLGTVVFEEIRAKAEEILKDNRAAWLYVHGSAGISATDKNNTRAFEKYAIIPRMLVDTTARSLETTIFGKKHSAPLLIAPIGVQAILHPEAELAVARAAKNLGITYTLSTAASRSIEEVAEANGDGQRWYQLYWPTSDEVTLSLLKRAEQNGYSALVVTLDTVTIGWRPKDLGSSYIPFIHGVGCQVGMSDPAFMAKYNYQPITGERPEFPYRPEKMDQLIVQGDAKAKRDLFLGVEWLKETNSGHFRSWEHLQLLRENWKGPLVLKGIQCAQVSVVPRERSAELHLSMTWRNDAERALECGADGIVVSNHGGRQVDGAIPSLYALVNIMKSAKIREAQRSGKLTVLFDSGVRTGTDIIKALALGAQAVLLGRPWVYGLAAGGQAGVEQVINHTLADLDTNLGLAGYKTLADIQGKGEEVVVKLDF